MEQARPRVTLGRWKSCAMSMALCVAVYVAAACGGAGGSALSGPGSNPTDLHLGACPAGSAQFTVSPVAMPDLMGWVPLGNLGPPAHLFPTDHQYLYVNSPMIGGTQRAVTVVAPGNVTISRAHRTTYSGTGTSDYAIEFYPCDDVRAEFGHVATLSPQLAQKLGNFDQDCSSYTLTGPQVYSNCYTANVAVTLAAGDTIGTVGGGLSLALDFSLFDRRTPVIPFANPARWATNTSLFDRRHVVPASDYFTEPARSAIRARLGNFNGTSLRTVAPLGGTVDVDVAGSAQGLWINPAQPTNPEGAHLALVPDNVDPTQFAISMGVSQPGFGAGLYWFVPQRSGQVNRLPSQVTADGSIFCYQFTQPLGVVLLRLVDANTLRVEGRSSAQSCAAEQPWSFGAGAFTYVR